MRELKVVTVVNNFELFERCIKNNEFLSEADVCVFNNSVKNAGISECYNFFMERIKPEDDFWVIFMHQDFIFNENPIEKFQKLDKNCIYGVIGILFPVFFLQIKPEFIFRVLRRCMLGQIYEGEGKRRVGHKVASHPEVNTLDCCCCIIHSSLIKAARLRFDENLKFHMYVEDLCITAKKNGILSRVIQFDCLHLSRGSYGEDFKESVLYIKKKHKIKRINSTCFK